MSIHMMQAQRSNDKDNKQENCYTQHTITGFCNWIVVILNKQPPNNLHLNSPHVSYLNLSHKLYTLMKNLFCYLVILLG